MNVTKHFVLQKVEKWRALNFREFLNNVVPSNTLVGDQFRDKVWTLKTFIKKFSSKVFVLKRCWMWWREVWRGRRFLWILKLLPHWGITLWLSGDHSRNLELKIISLKSHILGAWQCKFLSRTPGTWNGKCNKEPWIVGADLAPIKGHSCCYSGSPKFWLSTDILSSNFLEGSGSGNPSLWIGKDWQC